MKRISIMMALGMGLVLGIGCGGGGSTRDRGGPDRVRTSVAGEGALTYWVGMSRPESHEFEVKILARGARGNTIDFVMPSWSPGRYVIYDFARHVQDVRAQAEGGADLPVERVAKDRWRVDTRGNEGVLVSYRVFANFLSGTFSQLDTSHASVNGPSVFLFPDGMEGQPITLFVDPPAGRNWRTATALDPADGPNRFRAANYDELIDSPIEVGQFEEFRFESHGVPVHVAIHQDGSDSRTAALVQNCEKLCKAFGDMFEGLPFERYLFLFHFGHGPAEGDGMEHRGSTRVVSVGRLDDQTLESATRTAAHELFHAWNVERLRPRELVDADLTREAYTHSLWIAEGLTSYFQELLQLRAGIVTRDQFRSRLGELLTRVDRTPGEGRMSVREASFLTWLWESRNPQHGESNQRNQWIDYYAKGASLGFLIDLEIRAATQGERGLEDVFKEMIADESLLRRGYTGDDFFAACEAVSGRSFADFSRRYVEGTERPPYREIAARSGLRLISGGQSNESGLSMVGDRVENVRPASEAARAGIQRHDRILRVGGSSVGGGIDEHIARLGTGSRTTVTVLRNGRELTLPLTVSPAPRGGNVMRLTESGDASLAPILEGFYQGSVIPR
ncbi:MAG: M61 family metallopeptidase [Planctomycetes bacterium]|nr:M61 family metallopeptidase [Planctomycetota bacterium]